MAKYTSRSNYNYNLHVVLPNMQLLGKFYEDSICYKSLANKFFFGNGKRGVNAHFAVFLACIKKNDL
jgi:hypothetical protein